MMIFLQQDLPVTSGGKVEFRPGTKLEFIYTSPDGINYFEGTVVKSVHEKSGYSFLQIRRVKGSGKRLQRRSYFRLKTDIGCNLKKFLIFSDLFQKLTDVRLMIYLPEE